MLTHKLQSYSCKNVTILPIIKNIHDSKIFHSSRSRSSLLLIHSFRQQSFLTGSSNGLIARLLVLWVSDWSNSHSGWMDRLIRRWRASPGRDAQLCFDQLCFNRKERKSRPGDCCNHWKDDDQPSEQLQGKSIGNLESSNFITPVHWQDHQI